MKLNANRKNVEEIIIPLGKRDEILNKIRNVLWKWNTNGTWFNFIKICKKKRKQVEVNDLSSGQYSVYKNSMLRSDLCDHRDAYIVSKWRVNVKTTTNTDIFTKESVF